MARRDADTRRKARHLYVMKQLPGSLVALQLGLSEATFSRWKRAAKEAGDDWEVARAAHTIAGEGLEQLTAAVVDDFMTMAQALLDDIKSAKDMSVADKVKHLTSLADAMTKVAASAGRLAPKISELGVAQDVMQQLVAFVQAEFPQHAAVILEIIEPFGDHLAQLYGS